MRGSRRPDPSGNSRGSAAGWKRDCPASTSRDEVRVMTVHGAKGLEANTVILADTTTPPTGPRDPRLLHLAKDELVWATARADDVEAMAAA